VLEQDRARHDLAAVQHEVFDQRELHGGQWQGFAVAAHFARAQVDLQIAELDRRARLVRAPAHERAHAREELFELERLGEVVVGASVEQIDLVRERVERGQHEDGSGLRRAQLAQERAAVDAREHQVEDDEVVVPATELVPREVAVLRHIAGVALLAQRALQRRGQIGLVLDDQDSHGRRAARDQSS
jgi:hypothetical protein